MKAQIHPKWFDNAQVTCSCGNVFVSGATKEKIQVEVCSNCHPFYTGNMKFVDAKGRVEAFTEKQKKAKKVNLSKSDKRQQKRAKRIREELARPDTLKDLRKAVKK